MAIVGRLDQYASMLATEFDDYSMSENLLTYSEQFDNASWLKNNYNVTANVTTAPDGTLTADKLIAINASTFHDLYKSPSLSSNTYTLSIFAKAAEQSFIQVRIDDGVLPRVAMFNLATGSVSSSLNVTSPTITSYSNGWYRCSITVTTNIVNAVFNGFPTSSNATYSGDGVSGIYIWGAQLEIGSTATNYTPTTDTAINRVLASTINTNITGLGTYYSSGFDENVGFTTFLSANVFPPYDPVYDEFGGTLFGAGQGRYMRQNIDKSVIVYNEIDEITNILSGTIATDPYFSNVALLLSMNGSDGSTTFIDSSNSNKTITVTGNCKISTTQTKFGGASAYFDGNGDYLGVTIPGGLGSTFTLEFWYYKVANGSTARDWMFNCRSNGTGGDGFDFATDLYCTTSGNVLNFPSTDPLNTWRHIAFVMNSGSWRMFVDGVTGPGSVGLAALTGSTFYIGGSPLGNIGYLNGYVDDFRITLGLARYTTNPFTPPTAGFPNS